MNFIRGLLILALLVTPLYVYSLHRVHAEQADRTPVPATCPHYQCSIPWFTAP